MSGGGVFSHSDQLIIFSLWGGKMDERESEGKRGVYREVEVLVIEVQILFSLFLGKAEQKKKNMQSGVTVYCKFANSVWVMTGYFCYFHAPK